MLYQLPRFQNMSSEQALLYEMVKGFLRLLFLVLSSLVFAILCIHRLEGIDVWLVAEQIRNTASPFLLKIPTFFWLSLVPFQEWQYFRYLFAPVGAFLLVLVSSGFYVRDIYHLPSLRRAFHYVTASLFASFYPIIRIDGGQIDGEDPDDEKEIEDQSLLRAIGGPGFVRIQPGNAVAFRDWQRRLGIQTNRLYFMRPFEMIARVVNLEDQHGHIDETRGITRDGIRLRLKSIDYRFCVLRSEQDDPGVEQDKPQQRNRPVQRSQELPYPFSEAAINSIAYSFSVSDKGLDTWHEAVRRAVDGALVDFISNHNLDYLTAPRHKGHNPRLELRQELFAPALSGDLRRWGAELHWMDIGHFEIDELEEIKEQDPVDQTRTKLWAAHLIGDARTIRAYGEAKRLMYQELVRAEAQAEMIMSITDALHDVPFGPDEAETLRHIFLARTAQILEALRDGNKHEDPPV